MTKNTTIIRRKINQKRQTSGYLISLKKYHPDVVVVNGGEVRYGPKDSEEMVREKKVGWRSQRRIKQAKNTAKKEVREGKQACIQAFFEKK